MGYDRGDSFPFNFEPNGIPFDSENRKANCHHDHIPFNTYTRASGHHAALIKAFPKTPP